jgi:3-methyladenine DNA glycosylase AlkD
LAAPVPELFGCAAILARAINPEAQRINWLATQIENFQEMRLAIIEQTVPVPEALLGPWLAIIGEALASTDPIVYTAAMSALRAFKWTGPATLVFLNSLKGLE